MMSDNHMVPYQTGKWYEAPHDKNTQNYKSHQLRCNSNYTANILIICTVLKALTTNSIQRTNMPAFLITDKVYVDSPLVQLALRRGPIHRRLRGQFLCNISLITY